MPYDIYIPLLTGLAVIFLGSALLLSRASRRAVLRARLGVPDPAGSEPANDVSNGGVGDVLGAIGKRVASGNSSESLAEHLVQAGFHDRRAPAIYMGAKLSLLVIGLAGLSLVLMPLGMSVPVTVTLILFGTGILFFSPNLVVTHRRAKRRNEVSRHLPDAIDLLEICASAGMGLDMAWNSVSDEVRMVSPTLADEMALTNLEIHLGSPRVRAMRNMCRRTGAEEIGSLVAVLVQSERFGTSVVDALRAFATSMREIRSTRNQEEAEKMAVKLLFPMILFIFPSAILVMIGPAAMTLFKVFSS